MSAFVLQVQDLDESGKEWNFAIGTDWLSSALAGTELKPTGHEGAFHVHAQRTGQDILVQGQLSADMLASCARCLADVAIDVDLAVAALFSPEHTRPYSSEEIEVRLDETNRDYYGGTEIVLDPMVREHLLLEVPMKALCSDDCEGIPIPERLRPPNEVFGTSALDARFAPLLKLKEELTKKEE
ncbi:MAG: DUF177 domain-containing protein [Myxococcales bacterium]|nr:DUF177 domain-containing protein [Myxococcales bacterium]MDH3484195.1 DUF177 domain-containing protein [Myxococcales bacterium]